MAPPLPRVIAALFASSLLLPRGPPTGPGAEPAAAPPRTGPWTVTERLDMEMVRRHHNFGYTDEEVRKYFDYPQVFEYDATGLAADRVKAPPAPGVHPRVLFHGDDLPALRRRLAESKPGKLQMDGIRAMLARDLTGPGARFAALYDAAAAGEGRAEMLDVQVACPIIYETFRCLIDSDEAAGRKAAAALVTLARLDDAELDKAFAAQDRKAAEAAAAGAAGKAIPHTSPPAVIKPPLRDYQETKGLTQHGLLGLGYDFAYGWMTDARRDAVRRVVARAQADQTILCAEGLPAFPANVSNWIPMHMRLLWLTCAVEGEPGYDAGTYRRCVEGYKRYLNVSMFPAGDMYESMGKNFLCSENLIPVADRGENLLALKKVRAQAGGYYLHAMDPWGGHFTFYDSLGGEGNTTPMFDVMVLRHLFPADPAVDFVYRNTVGENYETCAEPVHFGHPFHVSDALVKAVFAGEYQPKTWDQARADATAGKPLTFFSDGTGNLITRSTWDKDAVQLHFLTRSVSGGHQYADRTHFNLHALGRYWAIYKPLRQEEEHYKPRNRSVVLIDGQGPDMTMAACVALADEPQATFIAADAKVPWEWASGGNNRFPKGGEPVTFGANQFRLRKSPLPWMDMPFGDLPYWQTSIKGAEAWVPRPPIRRAFRTAGLVRGAHPYVLIVDDIQKDDAPHEYQWGMILADDLVDVSAEKATAAGSAADVLLGERTPGPGGGRFLLVRPLNADGTDPDSGARVERFELPNPPQKPIEMHRLVITRRTVAPDFKTLLFPFRQVQERPKTTWNADRTALTIQWDDQKDEVSFNRAADGRTRVGVSRDGKQIVAVP